MNRKEFLQNSCFSTCALLIGAGLGSIMEGCTTLNIYKTQFVDQKISVPLVEMQIETMKVIRPTNMEYDILLIKKQDGEFTALLMRCSHQDFQLVANSRGLNCSQHGSSFDLDGNVLNGPATDPLKKFKTKIEGNQIIIF